MPTRLSYTLPQHRTYTREGSNRRQQQQQRTYAGVHFCVDNANAVIRRKVRHMSGIQSVFSALN